MKKFLLTAIIIVTNFAFAAGPNEKAETAKRELTRTQAVEILASKDANSKEKYLAKVADIASATVNLKGNSGSLKSALLQGNADFLVTIHKLARSTETSDKEQLKFLIESSIAAKTENDAQVIANIARSGTAEFKSTLLSEVSNGKSLSEAIKSASTKIGKTGKDEITYEKLKECLI